jgi:hypothetical protein
MNIKQLKFWLSNKEYLFKVFEKQTEDFNDKNKRRIFIDRGSKVLLMAHIDTVLPPKFIHSNRKRVWAIGLDDRLGCAIAEELSRILNTDLLICDLEESAKSTGQYHKLKDYNEKHWKIGNGMFSDISMLDTKACCMNVGIGYRYAHSKDSYADLDVMRKSIAKFKTFFNDNKDIKYLHDYIEPYYDWKTGRQYSDYNKYHEGYYDWIDEPQKTSNGEYYGECEVCHLNNYVEYVFGHIICEDCFDDLYYQYHYGNSVV